VVVALVVGLALPASATQKVLVTDDTPIAISVSSYQLTLMKLPAPVAHNGVMTVNPAFEIRANGRHLAIDTKNTTAPGDLVVMTDTQSYVFQVTPKAMPADMIVVEDTRVAGGGGKPDADPVRRADSYQEANVELIQQTAQGTLPRACVQKDVPKEAYPKWLELEVVTVREYRCPQYTVRTFDLYNATPTTHSLRQTEFFTGQELSIALDRTVINTGDTAVVYIVTYTQPERTEKAGRRTVSPDPESGRGRR
jgi:hypothetical protein